jgi:hypothetical protein
MTLGLNAKFFPRARAPLADEACDLIRNLVWDVYSVRIPRQLLESSFLSGAYFASADDLASVSSDVVIDVSQTTAWKTHLPPEGLSRHC